MESANELLRDFLRDQRLRARLSIEAVAEIIRQPSDQVQAWEMRPIKAPLNQISKMVRAYKTNPIAFHFKISQVERLIRKGLLH